MTDAGPRETSTLPPCTLPEGLSLTVRDFDSVDAAQTLADTLMDYLRALSRGIDLSGLDGVTVAGNYAQALLDLDRGFEASQPLVASSGDVVGVAMSPAVMRDGRVKSHLVFDADFLRLLLGDSEQGFNFALNLLAHECAHAESRSRFEQAFPGRLLQPQPSSLLDAYRWQVIDACWDEYAATYRSANYGSGQTESYEATFVQAVATTRDQVLADITAYRTHADIQRLVGEAFMRIGRLLKFSSYHLGNLHGLGLSIQDRPASMAALDGHWFAPHLEALSTALTDVNAEYGRWTDMASFQRIADVAETICACCGIHVVAHPDGLVHVDVPLTPETTPDYSPEPGAL